MFENGLVINRATIRKASRKRCKFWTQPYKNIRTRERARAYYWPPVEMVKEMEPVDLHKASEPRKGIGRLFEKLAGGWSRRMKEWRKK